MATPKMVSVMTFATYSWIGNELTAEIVFPALGMLDILHMLLEIDFEI